MQQTVLIIDDSKDDVLITKRVLSKIRPEIRTEVASSGSDGLTLLRNAGELPALILLDLKMPGMSGFDMLRLIRADAHMKDIPVVVVTSSSLEADEKQSYTSGANGFLHKAIDTDQFTGDIRHLLERWLQVT
jgi:CheY-like chemotaxis protein